MSVAPAFIANAQRAARLVAGMLPGNVDFGTVMAILNAESGGTFADDKRPNGTATVINDIAYTASGKKISSALGPLQIVRGSSATYGVSDPAMRGKLEVALPGALRIFSRFGADIDAKLPGLDPDVRALLIYYGHAEGGNALRSVLALGRTATLADVQRVRPTRNRFEILAGAALQRRDWESARAGMESRAGREVLASLISRSGERMASKPSAKAPAQSGVSGMEIVFVGLGLLRVFTRT